MTRNPSNTPRRMHRPTGVLQGFTAVEIAMVATVIAILALLILPVFRERTEAARRAAVVDEMASIAKAQLMAEADTNFQFRLQDLMRADNLGDPGGIAPRALWNGVLDSEVPVSRTTIAAQWGGPYLGSTRGPNVRNVRTIAEIAADPIQNNYIFNRGVGAPGPANGWAGGFIYVVGAFGNPDHPQAGADFIDEELYPLDPWGNPYIFFGKGRFPVFSDTESTFQSSVVYSLGPNGLPGDELVPFQAIDSYRRPAPGNGSTLGLSNTDDYVYRF